MRIIAGKFGSQPLLAPKGWKTRPTSDRLRETLFNVLAPRIEGAIFADLFAGTGAVGIEALSRGARHVYFAENSKLALPTLRANLERFPVASQCAVDTAGTMPLLRRLARQNIPLDLVFLDPPYSDATGYQDTLEFLGTCSIVSATTVVVAEHARRTPLASQYARLTRYRVLEQGDASLSFFAPLRDS
ncbi:MAG TPA: 16S rRNA (guanine(966)-N(2))-methyltransferase RsmD [Acidobacteriaceae bacterium]|nr:16S rRNA (guanine(966)-N(2))-methyltransferase RsmD [Acidobacteriaceae bacterium]